MEPWRRNLYIIWAAQFIAMMGMSLVVPFLPFYIRSLGVTATEDVARWSGLVFAGPFFLSFFLTPVWGYLGDRYGRKLMTVRAVIGLGISQLLIALAPNVEMLFFFRMVQGAISGFLAAALALVSANTPREKAGYAVGMMQTAQSSGNVIGPLVGGSLADAIGFRPVFYVVAALCIASGFLIIRFVQETAVVKPNEKPKHSLTSNYGYAFHSKPIRIALGIILISQVSVFMIQPIFALFVESLVSNTEYIATMAGAIFAVAGVFTVISAPWWGKRNDAKSYKKNLSIALFAAGLSYAAQGLVTNPYQLIFFRATLGFCLGGMLPTLYSYVSKNSSLERRGGIMGIASSCNVLANMIGPPVGGLIAAHVGLRQNFFITGGFLLTTVILVRTFFVDMREGQTLAAREEEPHTIVPVEE
ncbi:MAG: MFS transporter [Ignavibacteriales bacterium]|nr:MFS transporter [Ignavibacteriales bacterium]